MSSRQLKRRFFSGYLFALGATAIWSGNFIIARGLHENIPPVTLAFWRWVVAVVIFFPFAIKPFLAEWGILKRHIPYLSLTALLGITIFNTLIYFAGHTTTAINLSLISITFPIFIVILSRFFYGEAITGRKALGILLVVTGVICLLTKGNLSILLHLSFSVGDIWMLMAAIIFAIYSLLLKRRPAELSLWAFQFSTFLLGLIFLLPFFLWETATVPAVEFDSKTVFAIFYIGMFASFSAFILWNKAIVAVGPTKAGMVYYTLPLFSGIAAALFLQEKIGWIHLLSAILIISGILIANYESKVPILTTGEK